MDNLVGTLVGFFQDHLSKEVVIFIISLLPILELRGGLIAAALLGVDWAVAFPICVVGNMLPIPFILLLIRKVIEWLKKTKTFAKFAAKLESRAKEKSEGLDKKTLKYKLIGLLLFVGIPLPGTGAWTGALVADALDLRMKYSLPIITLGVILAGIIVSLIGYGIPAII